MKTKFLHAIAFFAILLTTGCSKEDLLAQNEKNIKKLWKLDNYLVDGTDMTARLYVTAYTESYQDNQKYDRSFTDKNSTNVTQNGSFSFETAKRLKISGVGSVEMSSDGTVSSSYYDIIKLTETELWYSFLNGNKKHEFRLSRK